jgi:hypothetical protein
MTQAATGRGKVAFQPIFSHLLRTDICFKIKWEEELGVGKEVCIIIKQSPVCSGGQWWWKGVWQLMVSGLVRLLVIGRIISAWQVVCLCRPCYSFSWH